MLSYRLTGFVVAGLLGACLLPNDTCACLLPQPAALVVGTVTVATGGPAAAAQVIGESWRPPCENIPPPTALLRTDATADAEGAFRLVVGTFAEGLQCARLTARLDTAEVARVLTVQARQDARIDHLDSVRVDLTLP